MDRINQLLEKFDWQILIFTGLRILLILLLMWGLMLLARLGLRRLEGSGWCGVVRAPTRA